MSTVVAYHEAPVETVEQVLRDGLKYGAEDTSAEKDFVVAANRRLDSWRPEWAVQARLSRHNCLYA